MRGDILFYTPKDWIGSVSAWATNGPFCHVAIDLGDGKLIEAEGHGIVRVGAIQRAVAARFNTASEVKGIEDGIAWLQQQYASKLPTCVLFRQEYSPLLADIVTDVSRN